MKKSTRIDKVNVLNIFHQIEKPKLNLTSFRITLPSFKNVVKSTIENQIKRETDDLIHKNHYYFKTADKFIVSNETDKRISNIIPVANNSKTITAAVNSLNPKIELYMVYLVYSPYLIFFKISQMSIVGIYDN